MLSFKVDKLYLPRSTRYIDFYLAYHLRNFKDTTGVFNLKRPNEYIFSSLSMRVSRFLEFHLSLRKGVNGDSRQVGGFDIMAGATAKWEL